MKKTLDVPSSLKEITLRQYQKFLKIQENNTDPYFLQCKMIEIFCNLDGKAVRSMKLSSAEQVANILNEMFAEKPAFVKSFYLNKTEYAFIPDFNNISFGEYIDLDTHISDWENMHLAMNVLYRPVKEKIGEKYLIMDYDIDNKDSMLDMPMSAVMGSIFFFLNLGMDLSVAMTNYLEEGKTEALTAYLSSQKNGDGISHFTHSLKEMLGDLKISLN